MLNHLVITTVLPLLAAAGLFVSSIVWSRIREGRGRVTLLFASFSIVVALLVGLAAVRNEEGLRLVLSSMDVSVLGASVVELRWDGVLWPMGLGLSAAVAALVLGAVGGHETPSRLVALVLTLLATGLAVLWSANPFTTLVSWAFFDAVLALGRVVAGDSGRDVVRGLAVGSGAGYLLWAGAVVAGGGIGSVPWRLMPPGGAKMSYWVVAGLLRMGVYPFHVVFPTRSRTGSPLLGAFCMGPVLGWGLWSRLALVSDGVLPVGPWMIVPAVLTLAGGAFLAWTAQTGQGSRTWMSLAGNGSLLLAAALGSARGEAPHWAGGSLVPVMMWGATGWMAGTAVLFLGGGMGPGQLARWRSLPRGAPSIIGALSLLGVPATSGFVVGSAVMRDLTMTGNRVWGLGFLIGQGLLVAALARWLLAPKPVCREDRPLLFQIVHVIALVILGVALILLGVVPGRVLPVGDNGVAPGLTALLAGPGLAGWLLWGGALLVGFILRIADARARPIISLWLDGLHEFARLEWVYDLLVGAAEQGSAAFRAADSVLTGRAALLWSSIALLLAVLLLRS